MTFLRFLDNKPGSNFVNGFYTRHPRLRVRTANLIKRIRVALSAKDVEDYFVRFKQTAAGIPASNIFNYDEKNLRDHPGAVKVIFWKGVKDAEQVHDHTKSAISILLCGSGVGVVVPPLVGYQGVNVYNAWCLRDPVGAVYSAANSGWFDMFTFTGWFRKIMLPHAK